MSRMMKKISVLFFSIVLLFQLPVAVFGEDNFIMDGNWVTENGVAGVRVVTSNITDGYTAEVVYYVGDLEAVQTTPVAINESVFVPNENGGKSCTIYIIDLNGTRVKAVSFTPGLVIGPYGTGIEAVNCKAVHFTIWGYATRINTGKLMVRPADSGQEFELYNTFAIGSRANSSGREENYYDGNFDVPENSEVYVIISAEDGTSQFETDKVITGMCPAKVKYIVTYKDGVDGTIFADDVHADIIKDAETPAFSGGIPSREGYTFKGWSPTVAKTVTENATYAAQWEPVPAVNKYKVTYNANADKYTGVVPTDTTDYEKNATVTVKNNVGNLAREGYILKGWGMTAEAKTDNIVTAFMISKDTTLYAVWEKAETPAPIKYTVTYTDGVDSEEIFADQKYTVEVNKETPAYVGNLTRNGYVFKGWSPEVAKTVTKDVIYVAQWEKNTVPPVPTPPAPEEKPVTPSVETPKTGDTNTMVLLILIMGISVVGLLAAIFVLNVKRKLRTKK